MKNTMPTMSEAAAYEFLRRALFIGGETLANFHETEASDNILFYAIENGESNNAQN